MSALAEDRIRRRERDFGEFLKVLTRRGRPRYLPFYEHLASPEFIAWRTGKPFDRIPLGAPGYWETYVEFWMGLGFDCIPMEITLRCPMPEGYGALEAISGDRFVVIRSLEDFERYPWPDPSSPMDFSHFETVGRLLPDGVKIVAGVEKGPYEWVSQMLGIEGLSYALRDCPELVEGMFRKFAALHVASVRRLAAMDEVGAIRQGDDLGFKTSTFLSPDQLRRYVFPIYKDMAAEAHTRGKPFILHSCGNLREVYDDIIACGVDAKHSFEDAIMPVSEFKKVYGERITPPGGLDVDVICRSTEDELRGYVRKMVEACYADGYWALGTGNSLTDYMPVENYLVVLDEALAITG